MRWFDKAMPAKVLAPLTRKSTAQKRSATAAELQTAEKTFADLERARAAALLGEDPQPLMDIGAQIFREQRKILDLRHRHSALAVQDRREQVAELEKAREEAVDQQLVPLADEYMALVAEVEKALGKACSLIETAAAKEQAMSRLPGVTWSQHRQSLGLDTLRLIRRHFRNEVIGAAELAEKLKTAVPGMAARAREELDEFIAECRSVPVSAPMAYEAA